MFGKSKRDQEREQYYKEIAELRAMEPAVPSFKFRIIKDYDEDDKVIYIVQEIAISYCYGEALGAYGWCNASRELALEDYFQPYYTKLIDAKRAIARYRRQQAPDDVVWEEKDEDIKEND